MIPAPNVAEVGFYWCPLEGLYYEITQTFFHDRKVNIKRVVPDDPLVGEHARSWERVSWTVFQPRLQLCPEGFNPNYTFTSPEFEVEALEEMRASGDLVRQVMDNPPVGFLGFMQALVDM